MAEQTTDRPVSGISNMTPERLRDVADNLSPSGSYWVCDVLKDAAAEIERLRAREAHLLSVILDYNSDDALFDHEKGLEDQHG
jgi:hypothetical protein